MTDELDENELRLQNAFLATEEMDEWQGLHEALTAAVEAGAERAELPLGFLKLVMPEIASMPTMFDVMKEAWNRVCDAEGQPDRKFTMPDDAGEEESGPF